MWEEKNGEIMSREVSGAMCASVSPQVASVCKCATAPSNCFSELRSHHVGEQVQGTRDAFRGNASSHIGFNNESRQAQGLLHAAQAFHNVPGRAKHHAFLQQFLISQGR